MLVDLDKEHLAFGIRALTISYVKVSGLLPPQSATFAMGIGYVLYSLGAGAVGVLLTR